MIADIIACRRGKALAIINPTGEHRILGQGVVRLGIIRRFTMPLLSIDYIRTFLAFVDNASEAELRERRMKLEELLAEISDREFRSSLRWMIRMINGELLTRLK